ALASVGVVVAKDREDVGDLGVGQGAALQGLSDLVRSQLDLDAGALLVSQLARGVAVMGVTAVSGQSQEQAPAAATIWRRSSIRNSRSASRVLTWVWMSSPPTRRSKGHCGSSGRRTLQGTGVGTRAV
ncbi:hypothetical protein LTR94_028965, partial [Friedmanniomyces endolithicus]